MGVKRIYLPLRAFRKGMSRVVTVQDARVAGGLAVLTAGAGALVLSAAVILGLAWRVFVTIAGG